MADTIEERARELADLLHNKLEGPLMLQKIYRVLVVALRDERRKALRYAAESLGKLRETEGQDYTLRYEDHAAVYHYNLALSNAAAALRSEAEKP